MSHATSRTWLLSAFLVTFYGGQAAHAHVYVRDNLPGLGLGLVVFHLARVFQAVTNQNQTASFLNCVEDGSPWVQQRRDRGYVCPCLPRLWQFQDYYLRTAWPEGPPPLPNGTRVLSEAKPGETWCQAVHALAPGEDLVLEFPWVPHGDDPTCDVVDGCAAVAKFFDQPIGKLEQIVSSYRERTHTEFAYHLRLFSDDDDMVDFDDELNPRLSDRCEEKKSCDDRFKHSLSSFRVLKDFLHNISLPAQEVKDRTGKDTFLATDSNLVKGYIKKKGYAFASHLDYAASVVAEAETTKVSEDDEQELWAKHLCQDALKVQFYDLDDITDFHMLSLSEVIYTFPYSSSFSKLAACRGGSVGEDGMFHPTINYICTKENYFCFPPAGAPPVEPSPLNLA